MKWWLSFADAKLPAGQQFLGVAIVEAPEFLLAVALAKGAGCNPGGDVNGVPIPDSMPADAPEMLLPMNKLLSKEDLEAAGIKLVWPDRADA